MNLTYLADYVTLAEVGNFHDAAEQLFISQSSLSKHIQALEKSLDVKLFERDTHNVKLTEYGVAILPHARRMLEIQLHIDQEIQGIKNPDKKKELIVGSSPVIPLYRFTNQATEFLRIYSYDIKIINNRLSALKSLASSSRCDLIIAYNNRERNDPDYLTYPYTTDVLAVVVPEGSPLARKPSVTIEEVADEPFVSVGEEDIPTMFQLSRREASNFHPNIAFRVDTVSQMLDLVTRGLAISVMAENSVKHYMVSGVTAVPFYPEIPLCIDMLVPRMRKISRQSRLFVDFYADNLHIGPVME